MQTHSHPRAGRRLFHVFSAALVVLLPAFSARAADGDVDVPFNPAVGNAVNCVVVQPDGKRILGGSFASVAGVALNRIARLNADGTLDSAFNPNAGNTVNCLALQPDGKILAGGTFTTMGGVNRYRIARLNSDGTLDTTFDVNVSGTVICLAVQEDGRILLGGGFSTITNGAIPTARSRIARLNADGTLDDTFDPIASTTVNSIAVQPDGSILLGGNFTAVGGVARNRIARIGADGTLDFNFDPNADGTVRSFALQADGSILAGGSFTAMSGVARYRLARLTSDGLLDASFTPAASGAINGIVPQVDGKILLGGTFTRITNGATATVRNGVARLMADGTLDSAFNPSADNTVNSLAVQLDGRILLGGNFTSVGGVARTNLALLLNGPATNSFNAPDATQLRWTRTGTTPEVSQASFETVSNFTWTSLGAPLRVAGSLADWQLTGLSLPANGYFRARGRTSSGVNNGSAGLVELIRSIGAEPDLRVASSFGSSLTNGLSTVNFGSVNFPFTPGNTVVFTVTNAGAASLLLGELSFSGAAALDYTINSNGMATTLAPGGAATFSITFAPTTSGTRTATLRLTSNDGAKLPFVVTLAGVGVLVDSSFGPNPSAPVFCAAVQPDGKRIIAGDFTSVGGMRRNYIARFNADGSLDAAFDPNAGNSILSVAVQADGKILLGGYIYSLQPNGAPTATLRSYLARLNADGSLDDAFASSVSGPVNCLVVQADGKILLGGPFTTVNGTNRNCLARLHPDGSLDSLFDPNVWGTQYRAVNSLAVQADGRILLGGDFFYLQPNGAPTSTSRNYLARLNADGTLDPAFDPNADGVVRSVVAQPDGKVLLGGNFTSLQPNGAATKTTRQRIARLNSDGTLDSTFDPKANDSINCLALQVDGRILVGGSFSSLQPNGAPTPTVRQRIARLNPDGTIDSGFNPVGSDSVSCLAQQADGKILMGGRFYAISDQISPYAALLFNHPATNVLSAVGSTQLIWTRGGTAPEVTDVRFEILNGFNWTSLGIPTRVSSSSPSWQLAGLNLPPHAVIRARGRSGGTSLIESRLTAGALPDLRVLQAGTPLTNGLSTVSFGSFDFPFTSGTTLAFTVTNAGSANLLLGDFSVMGPAASDYTVNTNGIAHTLPPGGSTQFGVLFLPTKGGARNATLQLVSNDGLKLPFLVALRGTGGIFDATFSAGPDGSGTIYATALQPDGKRIVAGDFNLLAGTPRNNIARVNADGTLDATFNPQASDVVLAVAVQADGKILIGGWFQSLQPNGAMNSIARKFLARLNADGSLDSAFDPDVHGGVFAIAVQPDGMILIGGDFTAIGPVTRRRIARLDGNGLLDAGFDPNAESHVHTLALQPDGRILIGGQFYSLQPNGAATPIARKYFARLNANGSLDTGFDPQPSSYVTAIVRQPDDKILIGGYFSSLQPNGAPSPTPRGYLARLHGDGSLDAAFTPALNDLVNTLALQTDGRILVGGEFTVISNGLSATGRGYVARLNPDGSVDPQFDPGADSIVNGVVIEPDGRVLLCGTFNALSGQPARRLALLLNEPATNLLSVPDASRVLWARGGSAPEVTQVTFELSTNGGALWTPLGTPARVGTSPDWQLAGLSLPPSGVVRARGRTSGGWFNNSAGLIEQRAAFNFAAPAPALAIRLTPTNAVFLAWPSSATGYTLFHNSDLRTSNWTEVGILPSDDGTNKAVLLQPAGGEQFYRLIHP